ncbi:unnamed protein product [Soboliphyme baturini]|uniref:C3H1-type domain-containing protein n=1 Tax=Soboliphyme baturini TaxID=241478 RepID=A0A183ISB0_9BILA|nr:unnamed protein product [Soboliphyme baturini]
MRMDKTFGLKNKKGTKQQKFIKMVTQQVKYKGQSMEKIESQKHEDKKKRLESELDDLSKILKPVVTASKLAKDVDPKSVLCVLFKSGICTKGDKCKFSHDLSIEGRAEKRNIYVDKREITDDDNIENWDEEKLNEVIEKKHGESNRNKPRTAIICKHFLKALEDCKYGWFWEHAIPNGYVLKKDRAKLEHMKTGLPEVSLEELIEKERAALGDSLSKITLDSFLKWKERKRKERLKEKCAEEKRKRSEYISGKELGLSGRELFTFNPDLMAQDDEEADDIRYKAEEEENEVNVS